MTKFLHINIDLLRHGEPEGGSRYRGNRIDDALTEKGWQQMREGVGKQETWDVIVSSPLVRCAAFAKQLGEERGIAVEIEAEFKEIGFGVWEGKTKQQLRETRLDEFLGFYADPVKNTPEGAEAVSEFFLRVSLGWQGLLEKHAGKRVLVIAHAGVIRAAVTTVLEAPVSSMYKLEIKNGRIARCSYGEKGGLLEGLNLTLEKVGIDPHVDGNAGSVAKR